MDENNIFQWLWIVNCFGCGNKRIWKYMSEFSDVSEAYYAALDREKRNRFMTETESRSAERVSEGQISQLISYCGKHGIYIMTYDDEKYPERLRSIFNPPAVLFCRGDITCLENDYSLSIVGTRKPSDYSVRVTSALVKKLVSFGITIVSGFAVGIDIAAGMSAVNNGGKTIAVLGCGIDYDYPVQNSVYRKDIEANGLFVSEYFPMASGSVQTFPARNRILTGLSLGTIVAEAGLKSGALNSATLAANQGKDVFVVAPHDLFDKRYGGNVSLIRDGATCLCGVQDIIYEYYENYGHKIANNAKGQKDVLLNEGAESSGNSAKKKKKEKIPPIEEVQENIFSEKPEYDASGLTGDAARVYDYIRSSGRAVLADDLAAEFDMDITEMLSLLTDLELDGAVNSSAGQSYTAN